LGGIHITQTIHDFIEWANPLETHQSGHAMGGNGDFLKNCLKCL
jgi:hypothetical protein